MKKALLATVVSLLLSVQPARAEIIFYDNFSQGLEKWQTLPSNTSSVWYVSEDSLIANITTKFTVSYLVPQDQFWNSTWKKYRLSFDYLPQSGSDKNFGIAFADLQNSYDIHFFSQGYEVARVANGQVIWSFRGTDTLVNGRKYRVSLEIDEGVLRLFLNEILIFDLLDPTFDSNYGKPVLKATTGAVAPTRAVFDNVEVDLLESNQAFMLPVPLFKQTDPQWADEVYDHAITWAANPSIGTWGCAITSAAMIFRYHGIDRLPDGRELTPSTLNSWLTDQPDGYIGPGLTNWIALTRLSRLMHPVLGTPVLEYQRLTSTNISAASNQIFQSLPVIVQIPGHFLVAKGIAAGQDDLIINDPAYDYDYFNQHAVSPISTRIFSPTESNGKYLLYAYTPETQMTVLHGGTDVENISVLTEKIASPQNSAESESLTTVELPNPSPGRYTLLLSQAELGSTKLQIFSYSADAEPVLSNFDILAGPQPIAIELDYDSDGSISVQTSYSWENLKLDIENLYTDKQLTNAVAYLVLTETAEAAISESLSNQLRYAALFENMLHHLENSFSPTSFSFVVDRLELLRQYLRAPP